MALPPVFLSYSRRDYYFAESCALHLEAEGVRAWLDVKDLPPGADWRERVDLGLHQAGVVVVLASRHSIESPSVREEWQTALSAGTPVIVAHIRGRVALPPELAQAPAIDWRGSFRRGLQDLVARLADPSARVRAVSSWPRLPPWILLLATLMAVLSIVPLVLADYGGVLQESSALSRAGMVVGLTAVVLIYLWYVWLGFIQRRAGSNRLVGSFLFFIWATGAPLAQHYRGASATTMFPETTMRWVRSAPELVWALLGIALVGLAITVVIQPEDLLRWMPTGKAWRRLRISQPLRPAQAVGLAARLRAISRFRVVADAIDTRLAEELRGMLKALPIAEATGDEEATDVVLLTSRTRVSWLNATLGTSAHQSLFPVVGSSISVPDSLSWVWRRQWLDLRRWDTTDKEAGLPAIPEALDRVHLPGRVSQVHHVVCATAALLMMMAGPLFDRADAIDSTPMEVAAFTAMTLAVVWGMRARGLVNRSTTARRVAAWATPAAVVTSVFGVALLALPPDLWSLTQRLAPALFLGGVGWWIRARSRPLLFWLPDDVPGTPTERLWPGRNWKTASLVIVYALAWQILIGT